MIWNMIYRYSLLFMLLLAFRPSTVAFAQEAEERLDPIHHISDGFALDFQPFGEVELPRIWVVRRADGALGLDIFGSTHAAIESGAYQVVEAEAEHDEPNEQGAEETEHEAAAHEGYIDAELVPASGSILVDLSISRHLVFAWLGALIVCVIFITLAGRYRRGIGRDSAPKGLFQNLFETLILFVRDDIARPTLGDKYRKYLPYLLTVFFFILTCNLVGLFPFGQTATSNIAVTAVLAVFTFVITQFGGTKDYWKHILWPPGVPAFVKPILVPVEILGMFTKPFALAIRLFANMTAGHLVILSLVGLIFTFKTSFGTVAGYSVAPVSVAFSLFIYLLELLVAFIQAYIFTMLSSLFIGMAVEEHHHDEPGGHAALPVAESVIGESASVALEPEVVH